MNLQEKTRKYLNGYGGCVWNCLRSSKTRSVSHSADYIGLITWDDKSDSWLVNEPFINGRTDDPDEFYITDREAFLDWCKTKWGAEAVADFLLAIEDQ